MDYTVINPDECRPNHLNAIIDNCKNIIIKVYGSEEERILDKVEMIVEGKNVYNAKLVNGNLIIKRRN